MPRNSSPQRVQSLEIGGRLLAILAASPQALPLAEIAAAADMPSSKARRYMVSLCATGLVMQNDRRGRYDIGPLGLHLGLAYLDRSDAKRIAEDAATSLRDDLGETVALTVWGPYGPSVISVHESPRPIRVYVRVGSVMPLTKAASGHLFTAFLPEKATAALLAKEFSQIARERKNVAAARKRFAIAIADARRHNLARVEATMERDMHAVAAPIFDRSSAITMVISVIGPKSAVSIEWNSRTAVALSRAAADVSKRLGYRAVPIAP
jgi:DNA-binding IclR family transcriptional regulator